MMRACRAPRNCSIGHVAPPTAATTPGRTASWNGQRDVTDDPDLQRAVELTRAYVEAETGDPAAASARCRDLLERDGLDRRDARADLAQLGLLRMRTGESDAGPGRRSPQALAAAPSGHRRPRAGPASTGATSTSSAATSAAPPWPTSRHARDELDLAGIDGRAGQGRAQPRLRPAAHRRPGRGHADDRRAPPRCWPRCHPPTAPPSSRTVPRSSPLPADPARRSRRWERPRSAYGSRRLRTFQAECELTLAWTMLRRGPQPRARVVARRAARRFRGPGQPGARVAGADAAALVAEIAAGGRAASLLDRVDALVADLRRNGLQHDATVVQLQGARVSVMRGDLDDASDPPGRSAPRSPARR